MRIFILIALTASLALAACGRSNTWIGAGPGTAIDAEWRWTRRLPKPP